MRSMSSMRHGVLLDDIRISVLLLAPLTARIAELMDRNFVALSVTDTRDTAVAVFRREDRTVLPVVEADGRLVGIITADDVLDVAEAAATEDIHKIGGMEAFDEPYFQISFARMIRKRAGWLVLLFLGEMLTATAMGFFEKGNCACRCPGTVHPPHYFQRRQLRLAGLHTGNPRARSR